MDFAPFVFIGIACSGPILVFIGIGRAIMCLDRAVRARRTKSAILAGLGMLVLFLLLAVMLVIWFGYGVAHTGKDATTDLIVLASTLIPAYLGVYGVWRLSVHLERGFGRHARERSMQESTR